MRNLTLTAIMVSCMCIPLTSFSEPAESQSNEAPASKVVIGNFTFQPNTLTLPVGAEVRWVNEDDVPHIVIGTDQDSPIKSPPLDSDDHYSVKLMKPGTYKYFCSLHPHMTGTIVVK